MADTDESKAGWREYCGAFQLGDKMMERARFIGERVKTLLYDSGVGDVCLDKQPTGRVDGVRVKSPHGVDSVDLSFTAAAARREFLRAKYTGIMGVGHPSPSTTAVYVVVTSRDFRDILTNMKVKSTFAYDFCRLWVCAIGRRLDEEEAGEIQALLDASFTLDGKNGIAQIVFPVRVQGQSGFMRTDDPDAPDPFFEDLNAHKHYNKGIDTDSGNDTPVELFRRAREMNKGGGELKGVGTKKKKKKRRSRYRLIGDPSSESEAFGTDSDAASEGEDEENEENGENKGVEASEAEDAAGAADDLNISSSTGYEGGDEHDEAGAEEVDDGDEATDSGASQPSSTLSVRV